MRTTGWPSVSILLASWSRFSCHSLSPQHWLMLDVRAALQRMSSNRTLKGGGRIELQTFTRLQTMSLFVSAAQVPWMQVRLQWCWLLETDYIGKKFQPVYDLQVVSLGRWIVLKTKQKKKATGDLGRLAGSDTRMWQQAVCGAVAWICMSRL